MLLLIGDSCRQKSIHFEQLYLQLPTSAVEADMSLEEMSDHAALTNALVLFNEFRNSSLTSIQFGTIVECS